MRSSTDYLLRRWQARRDAQMPKLLGQLLYAGAWISALPVIYSLSQVLGGDDRSMTYIISSSFMAAAVLTCMEFTSEAGATQTSDWISTWPMILEASSDVMVEEHNGFGPLQAFEMAYMLSHSRTLWLYAMDRILLAIALGAQNASRTQTPPTPQPWSVHLYAASIFTRPPASSGCQLPRPSSPTARASFQSGTPTSGCSPPSRASSDSALRSHDSSRG